MAEVWLVIERSEDEGTDWAITLGVYSTKEKAEAVVTAIEARHVLSGPGEWCECHGADWRVEGPFLVDEVVTEAAAVPTGVEA